ncbi:MAG: Cna B-type domain-containing protein, partial [Candidatus Saccharibacteria bacterium]|nr:Cna B-type domain-containing protein [Candidatus Saccharibacteria bacterium]
MKRFTRKRALVCSAAAFVTAAVVFAVTLVINNFSAFAATIGVQYSGVGGNFYSNYFTVDGNPAYCSWHTKSVPTGNASQIKNVDVNTSNASALDKLIYKVIYYGQINGYTHQHIAIAINNANNQAGAGPSWQNPSWYGYNHGYVITDGQVNGTTVDTYGVSGKSDLLTLAANSALPVGTDMHLIIWSNGNNNTQNLSQITYSPAIEEKFNLSVVKEWNDTDIDGDISNIFNGNSVTSIVPHSADISIAATVNVSYNGSTKVLRNYALNQSNNFTAGDNDISCHQVKSDLFNVTNDYTCNGLSLSTTETAVPAKYNGTFSSSITPQSANVTNGGTVEFLLDNQFYTSSVSVIKTWNDNDTLENDERPHYITFDVRYRIAGSSVDTWSTFKRYEKIPIHCAQAKASSLQPAAKENICYNQPDTYTFDNLPAFLLINGKFELVEYKAFEVALYDGNQNDVTSTYEKTEGTITFAGNDTTRTTTQELTNTDLTSLPVEKVWLGDEDYLEDRPQSIIAKLMCGDDEVLDASGNPITITLNAANNWRGEFTNLTKSACAEYSATETVVPENYTREEYLDGDTYKLINKHDVNVKVKKEWTGDEPDVTSLTVGLTCMGSSNVIATAVLSANNNWEDSTSWAGRPYGECNGNDYYVREIGYAGQFALAGVYPSKDADGTWVYTLDNIKEIDIPVEKAWKGRSDNLSSEVKVVLLCEDNDGNMNPYMYNSTTRAELTLNTANNWSGTFTNILGGNCRSFGIAEVYADGSNNLYQDDDIYTKTTASGDFKFKVHYTGDAANGFTVTNEELIDIPVRKSWDDEGDGVDTDRPDVITAALYCVNGNDRKLASIEDSTKLLTKDNEYSERWTNLSTSACERYEVEEILPSSHGYGNNNYYYESNVTGDETNGYQITNTKYVDIPVAKVWNYRNPSNIPNSVDIVLVCNGSDVANTRVTLTKAANMNPSGAWLYNYTHLKASDCPSLTSSHHGYTVREIIPEDATYNATVSTAQDGTVIITNKEEFNIPVEKVWDTNLSSNDLPDSVEVSLFCGPYSVDTITLRKSEGWRGEFGPLTKDSCVEQDRFGFFVVENTEVPGFKATIDGNAEEGFTITNTEYTHLEVHKTWNKRNTTQTPSSLELQLVC